MSVTTQQPPAEAAADPDSRTFHDLMRSSYDEYGIEGSPFVFPAWLRRAAAWIVSWHWSLFALTVVGLHRVWGLLGRKHPNELARLWAEMACRYTWADAARLARAVRTLDKHGTFRGGCRTLGYRNCLEAMFHRGAFLDPFYAQGAWRRTEFTHPHQQPPYFVPGIPSQRYYDKRQFEWTADLEAAFPALQEEVLTLLGRQKDQFGTFTTEFGNAMPGWNTLIFYVNGRRQEAAFEAAPRSGGVAESLLKYEEGELTMYSSLNPQSRIPPHVGPLNGILRCHLPILVPDGCGLRVGGQDVTWTEGEILVFDDSFVHEVWNHSDDVRIVLFFNAWHPCLSADERTALAELRRAYNNTPVGREWLKRQETTRPSSMA